MKVQILFSGKNKRTIYIINSPSAESVRRVLKGKFYFHFTRLNDTDMTT